MRFFFHIVHLRQRMKAQTEAGSTALRVARRMLIWYAGTSPAIKREQLQARRLRTKHFSSAWAEIKKNM